MRSQSRCNRREAIDVKSVWGSSRATPAGDRVRSAPAPASGRTIVGVRHTPCWLLLALLLAVTAQSAAAKSLYVIADIYSSGGKNPVRAYDIGPDGKLTFQTESAVTMRGLGPVGLALDAKSQRLFITFEDANVITLVDATTMREVGAATAEGAKNLAGIVYDQSRELLYCMDRNTPTLYVYRWDTTGQKIVQAPGSPFPLSGAQAFGIALDEIKGELYVGGLVSSVRVYSTTDWRLLRMISVNRIAISVAVDPVRRYLYFGGSYPVTDNFYLSQYNLADGTVKEAELGPDAGVMGLGVDLNTGFLYMSTGLNNESGSADLRVYDSRLRLIHVVEDIGHPTGLVVPNQSISFNPLHLTKTILTSGGATVTKGADRPPVTIGEEVVYSIGFDRDDQPLTNVSLVDMLPAEVTFVRATGDGTYGRYDLQTRSYTWLNPPSSGGLTTRLELVGRVEPNTPAGRMITNSATLTALQRPATTATVTAVAVTGKTYKPLRLTKSVTVGTTRGDGTTPASANAGDELTYRITFDNKDNNFTTKNIRLVDTLPPQVKFVSASDDGLFGRYDRDAHTYTWTYPQLASGESNTVELVVRLDATVAGGARITNNAMIESDDTPLTRATVDVLVVNYDPLHLQKTLVRGALDQPDVKGRAQVEVGVPLTYLISFTNPAGNQAATQVSVVDTLPREVRFLSADGDRDFGAYDPNTHTYTWHYSSLEPGREYQLKLVVSVREGTEAGTVIRNSAYITSQQTPQTTTNVDVVVVNPSPTLVLRKTLAGGGTGQRDNLGRPYVNAGGVLTYTISFSNPPANKAVTQVVLVDTLPREVRFQRADGDGSFGLYDRDRHIYTWRYPSLAPGAEQSVNLVVQVNEKTAPDTVITNSASLSAQEATTASVRSEVVVIAPPITDVQGQMYFKPDHIFRNSSTTQGDLMVVVHLPEGIGREAISEASLMLTPGHVLATGQVIFGTSTQGKVLCFFNINSILAATQGYGQFPLTVTGRLRDGRSFACERTISILKFGGP